MSELIKKLKEERIQGSSAVLNYSNFDYWVNWDDIVDIVEDHDQPQLNENQQLVFEWLKEKYTITNIEPVELLWRLHVTAKDMDIVPTAYRFYKFMTKKARLEVLQAFSEWALEQEEE